MPLRLLLSLVAALCAATRPPCAAACGPSDDAAQCTALEQLFKATGGSDWQRKEGWLSQGTSYCRWAGVKCEGSAVVGLNLSKNSLSGKLPPVWPAFANLTELNLHSNKIEGHINANLGRLTKLRDLNIYDNLISGTIPWEIGITRNLVGFRAAHNGLSGTIPCLGSLSHLEALHLFNNRLTGGLQLAELGQLPKLSQLDLANNALTGSLNLAPSLCDFVNRTKTNMSVSPMTCNLSGLNMNFTCPLPCGMGPTVCNVACRTPRQPQQFDNP